MGIVCKFIIRRTALIILCGITLFSCTKIDDGGIRRSVLIYMAGNNNLSSNAVKNLEDLKKGFVPEYFDPGKGGDVLLVYYHITNQRPKLLRISKYKGVVREEIIKEYSEIEINNSCSKASVELVLAYANKLFPAKENGLIFWSHGTGWVPSGFYSNPVYLSSGTDGQHSYTYMPTMEDSEAAYVKSFGSEYGQEVEIIDLANALPIKYSFILFDACLMGGVEVAYEFKDKCNYFISSPTEVLSAGFPYSKIMAPIFQPQKSIDYYALCEEYFNYYKFSNEESMQSATISLVKTSELEQMAKIVKQIMNNGGRENINKLDMSQIQGFFRLNKKWYYDMDDFLYHISTTADYTGFNNSFKPVIQYKASTPYFLKNTSSQFEIKKFSGLSIYVPNPENKFLSLFYKTLSWNKAVGMIE